MAEASSNSDAFERTLEDLTDDAETTGNVLSRNAVDRLYLRRNIDPDQAIAIEKALRAEGITIAEETLKLDEKSIPEAVAGKGFSTALDHLLSVARTYPFLNEDEEAACGEAIQRALQVSELEPEERTEIDERVLVAGEQARFKLIKSNIRLVAKFVFEPRFRNRHDIDDLVQMGLMGLMRASEKFDPDYGCRFSTYASWWIRQGLFRGIATDARTIRVPVHVLDKVSRYRKTRHALGLATDTSGKAVRKIAESLGWSDAFTARIAQIAEMRTVSLDASVGTDQDTTLAELVPDSKPGPEEITIANDTSARVRAIIEELNDDRLQDIITRRFGLNGVEETLQSIGESYGITRERIRQLEEKAMKSLKRHAIKKKLGTSRGITR